MNLQRWVVQALDSRNGNSDTESVAKVIDFVSQHLPSLLEIVSNEGFLLLLLHVYPFFQYQDTMFEAFYSFLDPLARRMSRKNVERLFSCVLIQLFDSATEPHQRAQLLSRTTADLILKRFSLKTLLERFLEFYIEAVIEPTRTLSKIYGATKRHGSNIVRMQSQSALTLMASDILQSQDVNRERGRKSDFSFSLALSETAGHVDYDSDKDYSTDDSEDDDDDNYLTEMSLLVKTDISHTQSALSSITEAPDNVGVAPTSASSHQPLMSLMLNRQENLTASTGEGSVTDQSTLTAGPGGEGVAEGRANKSTGGGMDGHKLTDIDSNLCASETLPPSSASGAASSSQTHLTVTTTPDSHLRKGYSHSFSSVFSEESMTNDYTQSFRESTVHASFASRPTTIPPADVGDDFSTSSLVASKHVRPQLEDPLSNKWEEEEGEELGEEEEEEVESTDATSTSSLDPQAMAVNSYLSDVAADCVAWLMRRLGPLLATQHIAKPLVDNLHRCFIGILNSKGRETSAMKCLSSYAEYYGEIVILQYYIPHAENLVS